MVGYRKKNLHLFLGKHAIRLVEENVNMPPPKRQRCRRCAKLAEFQGKWLRHSRKGEAWGMLWNTPFSEHGPWGVPAGKKHRAPVRGEENPFFAGKNRGAQ